MSVNMACPQNNTQFFLYLAFICLIVLPTTVVASSLPRCSNKCGNITIPYPFSTHLGCYCDGFYITCNNSITPPKAFFSSGNIEIIDINITNGEARFYNNIGFCCCNSVGLQYANFTAGVRFHSPYLFAHRCNKFTAIGCSTLAYIVTPEIHSERNQPYISGCVSFCGSPNETTGDGGLCNGLGCCQTSIPEGFTHYKVNWGYVENLAWKFNLCMYPMLVEEDWYKFKVEDLNGQNFLERTGGDGAICDRPYLNP